MFGHEGVISHDKAISFLFRSLDFHSNKLFAAGSAIAQGDAIKHAEEADKSRVGIAETKDIAEAGFIFGLPIVMNYGVMMNTPSIVSPASSRRRSTKSKTSPMASRTRTRRSSRPTVTRHILSFGWTSVQNR